MHTHTHISPLGISAAHYRNKINFKERVLRRLGVSRSKHKEFWVKSQTERERERERKRERERERKREGERERKSKRKRGRERAAMLNVTKEVVLDQESLREDQSMIKAFILHRTALCHHSQNGQHKKCIPKNKMTGEVFQVQLPTVKEIIPLALWDCNTPSPPPPPHPQNEKRQPWISAVSTASLPYLLCQEDSDTRSHSRWGCSCRCLRCDMGRRRIHQSHCCSDFLSSPCCTHTGRCPTHPGSSHGRSPPLDTHRCSPRSSDLWSLHTDKKGHRWSYSYKGVALLP